MAPPDPEFVRGDNRPLPVIEKLAEISPTIKRLKAEIERLKAEIERLGKKSDEEMLRVKACEHIAEGEDGWEQLRNICPSTLAVATLRDEIERLKAQLKLAEWKDGDPFPAIGDQS